MQAFIPLKRLMALLLTLNHQRLASYWMEKVQIIWKLSSEYMFLSGTSHTNCIALRCLINMVYLRHVPLSGHDDVAHFELRRL